MAESKLKLLFCVSPIYGHVMPLRSIAKAIIKYGYEVTFVTGTIYEQKILEVGATFIPLGGISDHTDARLEELNAMALTDPAQCFKQAFIDVMPDQFKAFQAGLKYITMKDPNSRIIVITEGLFCGTVPDLLGAPGIHPVGHIAVGVIPMVLSSIDTGPFSSDVLPDSSSEGRNRNSQLTKEYQEFLASPDHRFKELLQELGASVPKRFYQDVSFWEFHRYIQMCTPSMEFPRSDAPPTIRFAGGLPANARDSSSSFPDWWDDIAINHQKKRIIFVSQGTLSTDASELMIPTMLAFRDKPDYVVVVALGKKGFELPKGTIIPLNSRVVDFIPFDDVLKYSNVFVTNGGYGAIQHGITHGVPLVVGGRGLDKPDNALRVEWAGAGVNLRTHQPDPVAVYEAVAKIVGDSTYGETAKKLQIEMQSYDPIKIIVDNIEEVAKERTIAF